MATLSKAHPDGEGITPLDIIFSCHVCSATFTEVYAGHQETVQGLTDGINVKDRLVTKLFLTQCCHVICSKHLENGAPAFHSHNTRPSAPCPVCVKEKGDNTPRVLYSIRGFKKGEYDEALSPCWFTTPPMRLEANGAGIEALRFHYVALVRFSRHLAADHAQLKEALVDTQNRLRTIQALGEEEHDKALTLERENLRLHDTETKLHKLQVRMPAIEHYLKLVPTLAKQNDQMRQQLMSLGITVPLSESLAYDKDPYPFDENDDVSMDYSDLPTRSPRQVISSHTAGRSPCTGYSEKEAMSHNLQSRPLKRQRVDSPLPEKNIHAPPPLSRDVASPLRSRDMMPPPTSRDMMPPPKKPLSRMKSMKKLFPTIRKKLSHGRYSSTSNGNRISEGGDVQMYDDKHCGRVERPSEHETSYNHSNERSPTRFKNRDESPYMTGALPVGHAPRLTDSPLPQLRSSVGHQSEQGDFKFRVPSPIKQLDSQQHGLPTERSYIRLMDGLSHDARLELGLQDPRSSAFRPDQRLQQHRQTKDTDGSPSRSLQTDGRNRWGSGHALLRQSPKGAAYDHPDPLRSNPTNYIMAPRNEPSMAPITPVPRRFQQPAPSGDSVVSPFFESDSRNARRYPRARDAERESSSIRSTNSQYQRSRATPIQVDWHEPRSLNGLSFFNSPRNMEYEPIEYRHESPLYSVPPQQQYPVYHSRYLNSRGFITRSDIQQSPYGNDSAYGSSLERPSYSRQARGPGQHTVPSIPFNRPSHSRAAPLPSAMPSTVSTKRSPIRTSRSQWNTLASTGVRSSRQMESTPSNSFMTPSRIIFDSSGRRSTRR